MTEARKVRDLKLDKRNANKGTRRGRQALDESLRELGAGRSVVLDREGRVIAGNKTVAAARGAGIDEVIVVQTDGSQLVAVQRTDLDLEGSDGKARRLAYADNRVSELDLAWDTEQIELDLGEGLDLGELFTGEELEGLGVGVAREAEPEAELSISPELFERADYLVFAFDNELDWQVAVEALQVPQVLSGKVGRSTFKHRGLGRVLPAAKLLALLEAARDA